MTSAGPRATRAIRRCACGCGTHGHIEGRGLVRNCYRRVRRAGHLHHYPRTIRSRDDVLDDWVTIVTRSPRDTTMADVARSMNMSTHALGQALSRARRDGDPRAIRPPGSHAGPAGGRP